MSTDGKIEALIKEHFPWGQDGYPARPEHPTPEALKETAREWIRERVRSTGIENVALALQARIETVLTELERQLPEIERPRLFYRWDPSHNLKSPESILDKIARDWDPTAATAPKIGFDDFHTAMDDLARFRIVVNFLSDAEKVCSKLEDPYKCSPADLVSLSPGQQALHREFALHNHSLEDSILRAPEKRVSGERCRKGIFSPHSNRGLKVEIQIQTMLQEAWDKKDHFLIYEPRRRGEPIDGADSIEIYAMSELLYVADLTFDRLLDAIRRRRGN
jgi:ppGpp synthetase/RelA/SpoT-type nucleotidyltranferase